MPLLATLSHTLRTHPFLPLLLIALGALTPLGLAPHSYWPITLLAIGISAELLHGHRVKRTAFLAWCYGVGLWAYGGSWLYVSIHDFGYTPAWLALPMVGFVAAVMALFFALMGFIYARFNLQRAELLTLPALWVLGEWLRSWLLTGFPWLFTGYAFINTPLAGYAPLIGVFGLSFIAVFSALALIKTSTNKKYWPALALSALAWAGGFFLQKIHWTTATGEEISVSIVQGNIPQESKWQLEWRDKTTKIYSDLSKTEWGRDAVIWPEAAIPMFYHEAEEIITAMYGNALRHHSAFVTGIPYLTVDKNNRDYQIYNSIMAVGEGSGIYFKQRLVPFGEYIPFEHWLRGAIPFFDMPMTSFTAGNAAQSPLRVKNLRVGPLICYEVAYPDLTRKMAAKSDVLVTISNDGWFGASIGPLQHFEMVRMRAMETGREIIRATNNGISAIIDSRGQVQTSAPQFKRLVLRATAKGHTGITPYVALGNWPILFICGMCVALGFKKSRAV